MNINDFIRKRPHQLSRHQPHKASQYDQINSLIQKELGDAIRLVKRCPVKQQHRNGLAAIEATTGPFDNPGFGVIRKNERRMNLRLVGKILNDFFGIGAGARSENGDTFQGNNRGQVVGSSIDLLRAFRPSELDSLFLTERLPD